MRSRQRADLPCGRRAVLAELGMGEVGAEEQAVAGGAQSRYSCHCPGCAAAQWDIQRLKYWMCARLVAFGADSAEVDQRIGIHRVDVLWRKGEHTFAIEVRGGPLDRALAEEHTERLREAGCDGVLWLCQPGYWVSYLPALGVADFAPPACDYLAGTGMLDASTTALVVPRRAPFELREFLEGWVTGQIAWGYRDEVQGGWATVQDWEHHTRTQAAVIARQRQELVNQRTALALSRKAVRDKQKQVMKLTARIERAELDAQKHADSLADVSRKLADHHRVDATLRATISRLQQTISHWQLVTYCAMLLILTFVAGAMVVK